MVWCGTWSDSGMRMDRHEREERREKGGEQTRKRASEREEWESARAQEHKVDKERGESEVDE